MGKIERIEEDIDLGKCLNCFAQQYNEQKEEMCIAPVCIKEYDYDPENRTWTKKPIIREELIGNIEERSFRYEGKVKYTLNRRTGDIYFSCFKEPISITLLMAIIRDADPKKQNKFENILRVKLNEEWEYVRNPLFAGKPNPESGKREILHTLVPKGTLTVERPIKPIPYYNKLEIVDD